MNSPHTNRRCQCPDCLINRAGHNMLAVLKDAEAVMSIVPPRSNTKEYLDCLGRIRAVIAFATTPA